MLACLPQIYAMEKNLELIVEAIQSQNIFKVIELLKQSPKLDTPVYQQDSSSPQPTTLLAIAKAEEYRIKSIKPLFENTESEKRVNERLLKSKDIVTILFWHSQYQIEHTLMF